MKSLIELRRIELFGHSESFSYFDNFFEHIYREILTWLKYNHTKSIFLPLEFLLVFFLPHRKLYIFMNWRNDNYKYEKTKLTTLMLLFLGIFFLAQAFLFIIDFRFFFYYCLNSLSKNNLLTFFSFFRNFLFLGAGVNSGEVIETFLVVILDTFYNWEDCYFQISYR